MPPAREWPEPTPTAIRNAIVRAAIEAGCERIDNKTVHIDIDFLEGIADYHIAVDNVVITKIEQPENKIGFICTFQPDINIELSPAQEREFKRDWQGRSLKLFIEWAKIEPTTRVYKAVLELTPSGWSIPALNDRARILRMVPGVFGSER